MALKLAAQQQIAFLPNQGRIRQDDTCYFMYDPIQKGARGDHPCDLLGIRRIHPLRIERPDTIYPQLYRPIALA